jgi:serine/threonine protein kinase
MTDLGIAGIADAVEIGRGGFGVVYRAREVDLDRQVAIKLLPARLDERQTHRFERERRALGTLSSHPHIVTVYRSGLNDADAPYIVMEFISEGSAADRLRADGPLPWDNVLEFGVQLAGAVETAHRHGVLHRDIKPGNILMSPLTGATLADFGIARLKGAPETQSSSITASLNHAPPEVIDGHRPNATADVYSLASTMYELLSGQPPHARPDDESMVPMLARIARDPVPELDGSLCPPGLMAALATALAKAPTDRPVSAGAFGESLIDVQRQLGIPTTRLLVHGDPVAVVQDTEDLEPSADREYADAVFSLAQAPEPAATPSGTAVVEAESPTQTGVVVEPDQASGRSKGRTLALILGSALVIAIAGVVAFLLLDRSTEDSTSPTTTTSSTTTIAARDPRPVVEALQDEGLSGDLLDYVEYRTATDDRDAISFSVPAEWTEQRLASRATPIFQVAPNLEAALRGYDTPGVAISVTTQTVNPDTALQLYDGAACSPRSVSDFVAGEFSGRGQLHTECDGGDGAVLVVAVATDGYSMLVNVQMLDERDLNAVNHLFDSISVTPENL